MDRIEIFIVDDHEIVRQGLKQLLETEPGFEVIGQAASGLQCLEMLETTSPDVILMDIRMAGISGIETTRLVCERYPAARIIILTIHKEDKLVAKAIQAGAKGFVLKNVRRDELIKAVREVAQDRAYLDPQVTSSVLEQLRSESSPVETEEIRPQLTKRELEILHALAQGKADRQISEDLFISEHTVRSHLKSVFKKLKVNSRTQAITRAIQLGLAQVPPQ